MEDEGVNMLVRYEIERYQEMIVHKNYDELREEMDRRLTKYLLAIQCEVMNYEDVHEKLLQESFELVDQVLDLNRGGCGWLYSHATCAWEALQSDMENFAGIGEAWQESEEAYLFLPEQKEDGSICYREASREEREHFLTVIRICHLPLHLFAVVPDEVREAVNSGNAMAGRRWQDLNDARIHGEIDREMSQIRAGMEARR